MARGGKPRKRVGTDMAGVSSRRPGAPRRGRGGLRRGGEPPEDRAGSEGSAALDHPWSVLHVVTSLELGGAQLATLYEAQHSRFAGARRVLAFGPGGMLDGEAARAGVETVALPALRRSVAPLQDARALLQVARLVRRLRQGGNPLLVHTHSSKAGIVGRLGAFLGGADCIVHSVHGFGHGHHGGPASRLVFRCAERVAALVTDGFTADSAANIRQGESEKLLAGRPARVVRCAIDVAAYAPRPGSRGEARAALGIRPDDVVVLDVSCLKPQKDPLTAVEVAARVVAERPRALFLLAGDGELRPRVEAAVARHRLGDRFRLLGWRRDVPVLLHASDVLLLTSRWEGLPQTLPQAMAAGLPIIATRVDGNPEAVRDGENGFLFAPGDVDGMTRALRWLVDEPLLRERMGERGRATVEAFSNDRMIEDLDGFYRELTGGAESPAAVENPS